MNFKADTADQKLRARVGASSWRHVRHMRAAGLPDGYPQFFERGDGCHVWDVDGRRYVDFMCSWGPNILGPQASASDGGVQRQMAPAICSTVQRANGGMAERLVRLIPMRTGAVSRRMEPTRRRPASRWRAPATGSSKILAARGAIRPFPW